MNWINNISLSLIVFFLCYFLLLVGDFILSRTIYSNLIAAQKIESQRFLKEDLKMREEAINNGYESTYYPDMFDNTDQLISKMEELQIGPLGGKPLTKTYLGNEGYGLVKYFSDRFGLRNLDKKWDRPVDTIFIGDSFIHGAGVSDDETIVSVYEEITNYNSLNLGFASNNPKHYSSLAHLFIPKVKPSRVIMAFYANDNMKATSKIHELYVKDNVEFFNADIKPRPIAKYKDLFEEDFKNIVKEKDQSMIKKIFNSIKYRKSLPTIRLILFFKRKDGYEDSAEAISLSKNLCFKYECDLLIVYIPNSIFWRPDARADNYRSWIQNYTSKNRVKFLDASKFLDRTYQSKDFAIKGPHLSPKGYNKIAIKINEIINIQN